MKCKIRKSQAALLAHLGHQLKIEKSRLADPKLSEKNKTQALKNIDALADISIKLSEIVLIKGEPESKEKEINRLNQKMKRLMKTTK